MGWVAAVALAGLVCFYRREMLKHKRHGKWLQDAKGAIEREVYTLDLGVRHIMHTSTDEGFISAADFESIRIGLNYERMRKRVAEMMKEKEELASKLSQCQESWAGMRGLFMEQEKAGWKDK